MQSVEVTSPSSSPATHLERFLQFYFAHPAVEDTDGIRFVALPSAIRKEKAAASKKINAFPQEGSIRQSELAVKLPVIQQINQRSSYDCYYVANLVRRDLGAKRCENVDVVRRLYLPLDFDFRLPCSVGEMLQEFGLGASAVIQTSLRDSYPHYQLLFSLDGSEAQDENAVGALAQRLCGAFGSDSVHDAKRILRLPGTINWKRGQSQNGKTVPLVTWCKIIQVEAANIWSVEEITEQLNDFEGSQLSSSLRALSREHSMTKDAVAAVKKKKGTKKAESEKDGAEFGWWNDVLERAEAGKASVKAGARHPAMVSWMGQMLRGGIVLGVVVSNLRLLAEKACEPSFLGEDDFGRLMTYVEKYRVKLDSEQAREFLRDEPEDLQGELVLAAGRDTDSNNGSGSGEAHEEGEARADEVLAETPGAAPKNTAEGEAPEAPTDVAPGVVESSGVAATLKDLEEREQVAILRFRDSFFDWLFTSEAIECGKYEREIAMLVVAIQHWRLSKDETLFIDFFEGAFRRVNCFIGNHCSARAEVVTPWGARAVSRAPMNEAELLAVVDSCVRRLGKGLKQWGDKLAGLRSVAEALGEELTDKEKRKVSLRLTGTTRLVGSVAAGMARRLGGSFGRLDAQPGKIAAFQNSRIDLEGAKLFTEDAGAPLRYSNPVQTRYVEEAPAPDGAWNKFLERAFPGDEGTKELIYRIMGYMMTTDTSAQKIFWFEGVSGSGKSSLAGVILALLGQRNVVTARMQTIAGDFGLSMCEGKLLCLIEEAENADPRIRNNAFGRLKEASSGNPITIQQKFKDERSVVLPTKFLLLSNKDLGLDDTGGGTLRRLVPIKFEHPVLAAEMRPDRELQKSILVEADAIASEAVRRWSRACGNIGTAFDVRDSIALTRGRQDTKEQLAGVSIILEEILEKCEVEVGHIPLPSNLLREVVVAIAKDTGVSLKAGRADKIFKDISAAMATLGATHSADFRPPGHHSKKYNGYSGVRFNRAVWERGLPWGTILGELGGHARFASELLCRANEVSDAEIDARKGTPALTDEPIGILE